MRSEHGRHVSFSPWNVYWPQLNVRCVSFAHMTKRKNVLSMFAPSLRVNPLVLLVVRVNLDLPLFSRAAFIFPFSILNHSVSCFNSFLGSLYRNHRPNAVRLPKSVGFWWVCHLPTYIPQAVWVVTSGIESCQSNYRRDLCSLILFIDFQLCAQTRC